MDIIKKIFCLEDDEVGVIGLCKFNDNLNKLAKSKEQIKKRIQKDPTLTQMLRRSV